MLVTQMVAEHGGAAATFAALADLTPAQLSRMMSPGPADRPPGVLVCLKLARASGYAATDILTAAGHEAVADVLHDITLNRPSGDQLEPRGLVTGEELDLVRALRTLTPNVRNSVSFLIHRAADEREPAASDLHIAQKAAGD
jgi:hypothetical protein